MSSLQLGSLGRSALQSHTYSGSNVRALMTAIEVIIYLLSVCRSMLLAALFFFSWRFIFVLEGAEITANTFTGGGYAR